MEYLKINGVDFSNYVNSLNVVKAAKYSSQTNALGDMVVDLINHKRKIKVGFIYLKDDELQTILNELNKFNVSLSFRNPDSGSITTANCIVPTRDVKYYTIQVNKVIYNEFTIEFIEL